MVIALRQVQGEMPMGRNVAIEVKLLGGPRPLAILPAKTLGSMLDRGVLAPPPHGCTGIRRGCSATALLILKRQSARALAASKFDPLNAKIIGKIDRRRRPV
jgi:hypothetical protein